MSWIYLIIAGFFEMGFTTALKLSSGFTKPLPTASFFLFSLISFWFLTKALDTIPLGVAYAVWTGIGASGTVLISILFFDEPFSYWKLFFIVNLIGSIVGLKAIS